jgi:serine/threonine-protein kinase
MTRMGDRAPGPVTVGTKLGPYLILGVLGRGAQGVVYLGGRGEREKTVAIKVLRGDADDRARARFVREAKAAAAIQHDSVVAVHDAGESEGGVLWYAMELVDARSLERRLVERGPLPAETAAHVVAAVARAVHAAHEKGVIHRDLKPSNVLLVGGHVHRPKVADFGLALIPGGTRLTETGAFVGTPCYASPEVVMGEEATRASDVYGLGAILYECLVGRPPFVGPSLGKILEKVVKERPAPPSWTRSIPPPLERICLHCLEKSPAHRPPTALVVAQSLERWVEGEQLPLADRARASVATARRALSTTLLVALGLVVGIEAGLLIGIHAALAVRP